MNEHGEAEQAITYHRLLSEVKVRNSSEFLGGLVMKEESRK